MEEALRGCVRVPAGTLVRKVEGSVIMSERVVKAGLRECVYPEDQQ